MKKKFYDEYKWEKCSINCFYKRISKWETYQEAIKPKIITADRIVCNKCWKSKLLWSFNKWRHTCRECTKVKNWNYYQENKDRIFKKRKQQRDSTLGVERRRLDTIFYSDPNIQKIISIDWPEKRKKKALKWEIAKDKYFYFLNRWYDKDLLTQLYWTHYLDYLNE